MEDFIMAKTTVCNMCGRNLDRNKHSNFNIDYTYGYDSEFDLSKLELDLCDTCLNKLTQYLIDNCKINPVIG
jgi:hypothetical protein